MSRYQITERERERERERVQNRAKSREAIGVVSVFHYDWEELLPLPCRRGPARQKRRAMQTLITLVTG